MDLRFVEKPEPEGPFGAKGMGELAMNPTAPAIINAIHDAVGVWVDDLPAEKGRVAAAMRRPRNDLAGAPAQRARSPIEEA